MKRIFAIIAIFAAALTAASAQSMPALLIPSDARSVSMAASTVALEPASRLDAEVFAGRWAPKTADNLMAGLDLWYRVSDKFALLADGTYFRENPYELTSADGRVSGSFTPGETLLGLGGNFRAADCLSVELKAKIFMSTLSPDLKGNAFGADLTVRYHGDCFSIAAGACNLGSPIKYGSDGGSYGMPAMAKLGGSYTDHGFTAAAELDCLFSGAVMAGLGLEYLIKDIVSLRAGYHYGDAGRALPSFASMGLGARFAGVRLNMSYLLANANIGGSFLVGLGYSF